MDIKGFEDPPFQYDENDEESKVESVPSLDCREKREWGFVGSDDAANALFDGDGEMDRKLRDRLAHIVDTGADVTSRVCCYLSVYMYLTSTLVQGHEWASALRLVNEMAWQYGGGEVADCHDVISDSARKKFEKGSGTHVTWDWLMYVLRPAVVDSIIREWLDTGPSGALGRRDFDALHGWIRDCGTDVVFGNAATFFVFDIVPALAVHLKGQRQGTEVGYWAYREARQTLNPLNAARNRNDYMRLILRDTATYDFLAPEDVRRVHRLILFWNGQGQGYNVEETIHEVKQATSGDSETASEFGVYGKDLAKVCRETLLREIGQSERIRGEMPVTKLDADVRAVSVKLWHRRAFRKTSTRGTMETFFGVPLEAGSSVSELVVAGRLRIQLAVASYRSTGVFPPGQAGIAIVPGDQQFVGNNPPGAP